MTKTKNIRRRNYRNLKFFGLLVFIMAAVFSFLAFQNGKLENNTNAANLAEFNAGYIISDYQMTAYNSMSEADIQNFLRSKGKCNNTNFSGVGTRVDYFSDTTPPTTWHVSNGHTVCLAEETNINGESIAHIIWQAAQDYRINPKVLIVLLQKETGIITDPIPNSWDYQRAAGYGCPDTADCSEKYYGLKNQIRNAAYLFRIVMDGNSSYYPIGYNNVRYSPDPNCGSSTVYIQNLATSALYRYTPYQPNAGALAAGYGTAYCGAYGNRNFYAYWQDWFGGITDDGVVLPESSNIVEGNYKIVSALSDTRALDMNGAAKTIGDYANVYIYEKNSAEKQNWKIKKSGTSYIVENVVSGKVLDVQNGSKNAGANIQLYTSNGTCAQKWNIVKNFDGTYTFYSTCSGLVLDVDGAKTANGANVQLYNSNSTLAQKWKLIPETDLEDGDYVVASKLTDRIAIDLSGGVDKATNGTNVWMYENNKTRAQVWNFTHGDDGYYIIKNPTTGKVLDVVSAGTSAKTNVQVYTQNNTCAQKWQIVKNSDSSYSIFSACSGLALDVNAASTNNGANVQIYVSNGTDAQKWKFEKLKNIDNGVYKIVSKLADNFVADLTNGVEKASNGTNLQMYKSNDTPAQEWEIKYTNDGYYSIINPTTKLAVDVVGAGTTSFTNVHTYVANNTCAQKWRMVKNSDNSYSIFSACSGLALDVNAASTNNGANVQIYVSNGTNAQKWALVKKQ